MLTRFARLVGAAALLAIGFVPVAHADTRFSVRVGVGAPHAVAIPVARPYGYVWQPGRYVWTGYRYRWIPGRWVRPWFGRLGPRNVWRWDGNRRWNGARGGWDRDRRDRARFDDRRDFRR